jgi:transitional endoplasmic reticulum ATPase
MLLDLMGDELFERGVVLIGATNLPWVLEPALLRSGRMDRLVYVGVPNETERKLLFRLFTKDRMVEDLTKQDIDELALKSKFFSCSDIKEVCNRACYDAWEEAIITENSRKVTKEELMHALENYSSTTTQWFRDAINTCLDDGSDKRFRHMWEQIELYKRYSGSEGMSR